MIGFLDNLVSDLKKGDLIKNILFCNSEYCSSFMTLVSQQISSVPDLVRLANPILKDPVYYIKWLRFENKDTGQNYLENSGNHHTDGIASLTDDSLRTSCLVAVEKRRFEEFDNFGLMLTVNNKVHHIVVSKKSLAGLLEEDEDFVYFPTSKSFPLAQIKLTELTSEKQVGKVTSDIFMQRLYEANERLVVSLWQSILVAKWTFDVVQRGLRILNAIMAVKGMFSDLVLRLPFKVVKIYIQANPELEVIEAFCSSLKSSSHNNTMQIAIKNIQTIISNPKQSFLLHLFAINTNQQMSDKTKEAKTVLSMRDFLQKDYLVQSFESIKNSVFKKVQNNWSLSYDEVAMSLDVMLGWISVKTSSMGRFWKARIINNLITNSLMAFYLKHVKKDSDEFNPTPEAIAAGKALLSESKRVLEDRLKTSMIYQKL